jgi:hypothetical protein
LAVESISKRGRMDAGDSASPGVRLFGDIPEGDTLIPPISTTHIGARPLGRFSFRMIDR